MHKWHLISLLSFTIEIALIKCYHTLKERDNGMTSASKLCRSSRHGEQGRRAAIRMPYAEEFALEDRVSVGMKMKDIDEVGFRLLKDTDTVMLAQKAHDRHNQRVEIAQSIATNAAIRENSEKIPNAPSTSVSPSTEGFRNSLFFVLGKLNDDGLMEAMRRILDVANDPKYCKNKETT